MKIILLITGLGMGGAETQVASLATKLSQRGHKVTLAYILEPNLVAQRCSNNEVIYLGGTKSLFGICKAFINLIRLIKRSKPDVIHSHMFHANIIARISRLFIRFPRLICTAHNTNEGGKLRMTAYRLTNKLSDIFTNVSLEAVDAFETKGAAPKNTMIATHNGINIDKFIFNPEARIKLRKQLALGNNKTFIAIGRFHSQKDYPNLLNAFKLLLIDNPNSKLIIVGDGELRGQIESLIDKLQLSKHVTLLGIRNDIPELLSAADIFVLSSAWEGFGLVVAEAMSTERIPVATNCGGVAEVMGEIGFMVQPNDSNALLGAMTKAIMLDEKTAKDIGLKGRQRIIDKYSLDSVVDRWEKLYSR